MGVTAVDHHSLDSPSTVTVESKGGRRTRSKTAPTAVNTENGEQVAHAAEENDTAEQGSQDVDAAIATVEPSAAAPPPDTVDIAATIAVANATSTDNNELNVANPPEDAMPADPDDGAPADPEDAMPAEPEGNAVVTEDAAAVRQALDGAADTEAIVTDAEVIIPTLPLEAVTADGTVDEAGKTGDDGRHAPPDLIAAIDAMRHPNAPSTTMRDSSKKSVRHVVDHVRDLTIGLLLFRFENGRPCGVSRSRSTLFHPHRLSPDRRPRSPPAFFPHVIAASLISVTPPPRRSIPCNVS